MNWIRRRVLRWILSDPAFRERIILIVKEAKQRRVI